MAVTLHMRPQDEPLTWEQFCATVGPYAVALDGYVAAGPRFDPAGPRVNFNHHEEVDRLATRSTCAWGASASIRWRNSSRRPDSARRRSRSP